MCLSGSRKWIATLLCAPDQSFLSRSRTILRTKVKPLSVSVCKYRVNNKHPTDVIWLNVGNVKVLEAVCLNVAFY